MTTYSLPKTMTTSEKAWLAGFTDGEGYLGILKQQKKSTTQQSNSFLYHPYLIITGTEEKTIRYLKELTGCGWIAKLTKEGIHKSAFQYKVSKFDDLANLLSQIQSFLKVKQIQSKLLLEFINLRKLAVIKTGRGSRNVTSFTEQEEKIFQELKKINRRGI